MSVVVCNNKSRGRGALKKCQEMAQSNERIHEWGISEIHLSEIPFRVVNL